jgi:hypothetical protein
VLHSGGAPHVQRRQVMLQSPRGKGAQGAERASATVSAGAPPHYNVVVAHVWVVRLSLAANTGSHRVDQQARLQPEPSQVTARARGLQARLQPEPGAGPGPGEGPTVMCAC